MMRLLTFLTVIGLAATLTIPVLVAEAERSALEIGAGTDEFAESPPPVVEDMAVAVDSVLCADDDLECAIRAQHMNGGHESD